MARGSGRDTRRASGDRTAELAVLQRRRLSGRAPWPRRGRGRRGRPRRARGHPAGRGCGARPRSLWISILRFSARSDPRGDHSLLSPHPITSIRSRAIPRRTSSSCTCRALSSETRRAASVTRSSGAISAAVSRPSLRVFDPRRQRRRSAHDHLTPLIRAAIVDSNPSSSSGTPRHPAIPVSRVNAPPPPRAGSCAWQWYVTRSIHPSPSVFGGEQRRAVGPSIPAARVSKRRISSRWRSPLRCHAGTERSDHVSTVPGPRRMDSLRNRS